MNTKTIVGKSDTIYETKLLILNVNLLILVSFGALFYVTSLIMAEADIESDPEFDVQMTEEGKSSFMAAYPLKT